MKFSNQKSGLFMWSKPWGYGSMLNIILTSNIMKLMKNNQIRISDYHPIFNV